MTVEKIIEILQKTDLSSDNFFSEDTFEDQVMDTLEKDPELVFEYASGASKFVIIPEDMNENIVIKIPFNGEVHGDEEVEFNSAACENHWDYCAVECNIYEKAYEKDLEMCFAKTEYIGNVNGHPVYKQEKAEIWDAIHTPEDYDKDKTQAVRKRTKESGHYCFNGEWLSDFLDYFGEEIFNIFLDFIEEEGVYDLHGQNLGYIGNRPVLVDYSDFCD